MTGIETFDLEISKPEEDNNDAEVQETNMEKNEADEKMTAAKTIKKETK